MSEPLNERFATRPRRLRARETCCRWQLQGQLAVVRPQGGHAIQHLNHPVGAYGLFLLNYRAFGNYPRYLTQRRCAFSSAQCRHVAKVQRHGHPVSYKQVCVNGSAETLGLSQPFTYCQEVPVFRQAALGVIVDAGN